MHCINCQIHSCKFNARFEPAILYSASQINRKSLSTDLCLIHSITASYSFATARKCQSLCSNPSNHVAPLGGTVGKLYQPVAIQLHKGVYCYFSISHFKDRLYNTATRDHRCGSIAGILKIQMYTDLFHYSPV